MIATLRTNPPTNQEWDKFCFMKTLRANENTKTNKTHDSGLLDNLKAVAL